MGRILSNTINGKKLPGKVGLPMPGITLCLVRKNGDNSETIMVEGTLDDMKIAGKQDDKDENISGELLVKGKQFYFKKQTNFL